MRGLEPGRLPLDVEGPEESAEVTADTNRSALIRKERDRLLRVVSDASKSPVAV
jgi:hypothetical protein